MTHARRRGQRARPGGGTAPAGETCPGLTAVADVVPPHSFAPGLYQRRCHFSLFTYRNTAHLSFWELLLCPTRGRNGGRWLPRGASRHVEAGRQQRHEDDAENSDVYNYTRRDPTERDIRVSIITEMAAARGAARHSALGARRSPSISGAAALASNWFYCRNSLRSEAGLTSA